LFLDSGSYKLPKGKTLFICLRIPLICMSMVASFSIFDYLVIYSCSLRLLISLCLGLMGDISSISFDILCYSIIFLSSPFGDSYSLLIVRFFIPVFCLDAPINESHLMYSLLFSLGKLGFSENTCGVTFL